MINFQIETNINCGWETSTTLVDIEYLFSHFLKQISICKVLYLFMISIMKFKHESFRCLSQQPRLYQDSLCCVCMDSLNQEVNGNVDFLIHLDKYDMETCFVCFDVIHNSE